MKFRKLTADEIDVRVQTYNSNSKGVILLLYKDARCDMNILDEAVGSLYWKREHTRDNANCIVSIYNKEIGQWISKEDTGTESFTEKEKGLASDSFKRACFNWGIGRELYTSPFIWVNVADNEVYNGKISPRLKFSVKEISYDGNNIKDLVIVDNNNKVRFTTKSGKTTTYKDIEKKDNKLITNGQIDIITKAFDPERVANMLNHFKVKDIQEMLFVDAEKTIQGIRREQK